MEKKKKTIFDYAGETLCIFAISMLILMLFTYLVGDSAKDISTIYQMGKEGLPLSTMLQFFCFSILITFIQYLCFEWKGMRNKPVVIQTITMLLSICAVVVLFVYLFGWFPMDSWVPWVLFILCFVICFFISLGVMILKTRLENKKMEEGLLRYQRKCEVEEDEK